MFPGICLVFIHHGVYPQVCDMNLMGKTLVNCSKFVKFIQVLPTTVLHYTVVQPRIVNDPIYYNGTLNNLCTMWVMLQCVIALTKTFHVCIFAYFPIMVAVTVNS